MGRDVHREWLRAFIAGDARAAERCRNRIPETECAAFDAFITGFYSVMLAEWFRDDVSRAAVDELVGDMSYYYRETLPPIKPLLMEGVLRAAFGEDEFVREIPADEVRRVQFLIIAHIANEIPEVAMDLDGFMAKAEGIAEDLRRDTPQAL